MKKFSKTNLLTPRSNAIRIVIVAGLICLSGFMRAAAAPITYTFTGVGSGRLGNTIFTTIPFTLTASADTGLVIDPALPGATFHIPRVTNSITTVSISGLGTATFTAPTVTIDFENPTATEASLGIYGFYQGPKLLSELNINFQNYDLSTSFGPISGPASTGSNSLFPTSLGDFFLQSVTTATFQAQIQIVPEPSILGLIGLSATIMGGLLGCAKAKTHGTR